MSDKRETDDTTTDHKIEMTGIKDIDSLEQIEKVDDTITPFIYSPAEKRLKRKIDRSFLPLVCIVLFVQFADKSTLNVAAVLGLYEDTHITKNEFALVGSLFYVGYLAFQIPNNFLIQRVPISKYMGLILVLWGVSLGCTALSKGFGGLAACRVILGFFEAVTYPCIFILIASFYRRHEQIFYVSSMFIANAVATALGGLIGYGIGNMQGLNGLSAWQYGFIIWGAVTVTLGIVFFFFLPDHPKSRWFRLTPEESLIVDERMLDSGTAQDTTFNINHVWEALKDPKYYCYCALSCLCNLQNGSLTVFSTQIIQEIGFTNLQSILLNIPNGCCGALLIIISTYLSRRYNEICFVAMGMTLISMTGVLLLGLISHGPVKLLGIYLAYGCTPMYILMQTSISNNVKGYSKKVFYTSSQLVWYTIGNFVGPQMMDNQSSPYLGAMLGFTGANIIAFFLYGYVRWSLVRANLRRGFPAKPSAAGQFDYSKKVDDRTDVEDVSFVYRP
ncbi:major facilitator superfamily domain-containing protein [Halteromyces radiatus]|uniref:major facilitator superfamily domain-containing protein n=1 Tax=Halteromyces radiatus TaxID=101107 RepID=UPI0022200CE9|nr:major facilitator superfamily domain-containing protein [Halteromyces radiatus]KAI8081453.1 major facilitator superfamily domain-containing protein [Halteromyces radiatus]